MKYAVIFSLACLLVTGGVHAQSDSSVLQPQPGQYGTQRVPDQQIKEQKEDRTEVQSESLPPAMLDHLGKNEKYQGWEDATIYYEKNTDQYLLNIVRPNSTETFRFDKQGEPIETDKAIPNRESQH